MSLRVLIVVKSSKSRESYKSVSTRHLAEPEVHHGYPVVIWQKCPPQQKVFPYCPQNFHLSGLCNRLRYSNRHDMNNCPGSTHMAMKPSFPTKLSTSILITSLLSSNSVSKPTHSDTLYCGTSIVRSSMSKQMPKKFIPVKWLTALLSASTAPMEAMISVIWRNRFRIDPNGRLSPQHPPPPPTLVSQCSYNGQSIDEARW